MTTFMVGLLEKPAKSTNATTAGFGAEAIRRGTSRRSRSGPNTNGKRWNMFEAEAWTLAAARAESLFTSKRRAWLWWGSTTRR